MSRGEREFIVSELESFKVVSSEIKSNEENHGVVAASQQLLSSCKWNLQV